MDDQNHHYSIGDLRNLMINGNRQTHFTSQQHQQQQDLFGFTQARNNNSIHNHHHYDMNINYTPGFSTDSAPTAHNNANTGAFAHGLLLDGDLCGGGSGCAGGFSGGGGDICGTGRWPRQETLTLLEIRSRLDHKFKEANQKGPLWDEVSRIMSEEHGYQRSGKKCREKFENLYKYYKKTKEGKAGRQDGKNYRFFRQLEALYGETSNSISAQDTNQLTNSNSNALHFQTPNYTTMTQSNLSLSTYNTSSDTSSSENNDENITENNSRKKKRNWREKVKEFIDLQMQKLIERQETWLEKLTKTLEEKEQERILREEEWRKQEAIRVEREHRFWAKEREWIEARDSTLLEALQTLTRKESAKPVATNSSEEVMGSEVQNWGENEITRLIELRTNMDSRFQQINGCLVSDDILWEEIAAKIAGLGFDKSALMCKEKWEFINNYIRRNKELNKKRKENSRNYGCGGYVPRFDHESLYNQTSAAYHNEIDQGNIETMRSTIRSNEDSPSTSNIANPNESGFRFLMNDGENMWENFGLKLGKGDNQ